MKRAHTQLLVRIAASLSLLLAPTLPMAGGYVDSTAPLNPATAIPVLGSSQVLPTFNNAVFTDQALISQVSNDVIRTPSTSDPVSTVNGNNYHDETDLVIKGRGGLNYVLTRTYNSGSSSTSKNGPLGYGWTHSYAMQLKSNDHGDCPNCAPGTGTGQRPENGNGKTASLTYVDERGGEHLYKVNESSFAVTAPMGEFDTLVLDTPAAGQHTLSFRNGVTYTFETVGAGNLKTTPEVIARLKSITDPYGNTLSMTYDGNGRLWKVTDNLGLANRTGLVFTYDANGYLDKVVDWSVPAPRVWDYTVAANGDLITYANPLTQATNYTYHAGHLLHEVVLPEARSGKASKTAFTYYRNGKTFNQANGLGHKETLDYDLYRKATRVTDPRGGIRTYAYSGETGALEKLTEPDGAILLFENTPEGLRNKKYDALGYATTYSYRLDRAFTGASDAGGNVTREQDALGRTVDSDYGLFDQVTRVKDKRGFETFKDLYQTTAGDGVRGRLQRTRVGQLTVDGVVYNNLTLAEYTYWPDGNLKRQIEYLDPADASKTRQTDYVWQDNGLNLQSLTVSGGGLSLSTSYTWDALGRMLTETRDRRTSPTNASLLTLTTQWDHDALDRVTQVTDPDGHRVQTVYDGNGKVKEVWEHRKQANGSYVSRRQALKEYDAAERLIRETDVLGNASQFQYDEAGNLIQATDPEGRTGRFEYDRMNRRVAAQDAQGRKVQTSHDLAGRPIQVTNPLGHATATEYDALGRAVKVINPLGFVTELAYDAEGRLVCLTDANAQAGLQPKNSQGCTVYSEYDELGRLVREVNALDGQTRYTHDLLGNTVKLTDPENHAWTFQYDRLGRQSGQTDPLGRAQTLVLDEAGNPYQSTDRKGQVSSFTYDRLNRAVQATYAGGLVETQTYDAQGDLSAAASNQGVAYAFDFDAQHRLASKTDQRLNRTLSFQYNRAGQVQAKTDYQEETTQYLFDAAGTLIAERNPAYLQVSYHHDRAGRLLDRILSSGAQTRYGWDAADRLSQITNTGAAGVTVAQTSYARDRTGRILSKTEGAATTLYTYDALYRLKSVDAPGTADDESYTYDAVGNRKTHTRAGNTLAHDHDGANRLKSIHQGSLVGSMLSAFVWDANGSLIKLCSGTGVTRTETNCSGSSVKSYGWDGKNRLAWVSVPGKPVNNHGYDSRDLRVSQSDSLGSRSYLLEGEHLEAVYSGTSLQAKYLRGAVIDEVVNGYQFDASGKWTNVSFHHDALQSVVGLSGHSGDVLNMASYGPFGESRAQTGTLPNRLMYTGREQDPDTGCYYYRARYYCPDIGRFISEDPIGFAGGINHYAYVGNDPINANDPSGLDPLSTIAKIGGRLGSAETRAHVKQVAQEWVDRGWELISGGGGKETLIKNPATNSAKGGAYADIELYNPATNQTMRINTVDTYADGITPTVREAAAAGRIQSYLPNDQFSMIPKPKAGATAAGVAAGLGAGSAQASNGGIFGSGITWSDVGNFIVDALIPGGIGEVGSGSDIVPRASTSYGALQSSYGGAAGGGFLLYPNKANTNTMRSVYSK